MSLLSQGEGFSFLRVLKFFIFKFLHGKPSLRRNLWSVIPSRKLLLVFPSLNFFGPVILCMCYGRVRYRKSSLKLHSGRGYGRGVEPFV